MMRGGLILLGLALALVLTAKMTSAADEKEDGFKVIFDGKSMDGWKVAENPDTFKLKDGEAVTGGPRAHMFYVGDPQPFKNFELRVDVMTEPNSNGGIFFHNKHPKERGAEGGVSGQGDKTHTGLEGTGNLFEVVNVRETFRKDNSGNTGSILL